MTNPLLTVAFPLYDDLDGLWFSVQALRLYHAEALDQVALLVVDNASHLPGGITAKEFLEKWVSQGKDKLQTRYLPYTDRIGPANAKDQCFRQAQTPFVLVMDSHVLLAPGALKRLLDFYREHSDTSDLYSGPLLYDNGSISTHFARVWSGEMEGVWATAWACPCGFLFDVSKGQSSQHPNQSAAIYRAVMSEQSDNFLGPPFEQAYCPQCHRGLPIISPYEGHERLLTQAGFHNLGEDIDGPPFEVWANGCGLLTCRAAAWPGFPQTWKGFGAEEGYIHRKVRQRKNKFQILPFLRWNHRFIRARNITYPLDRFHKVRNYVIGYRELNLPLEPIHEHFVASGRLSLAHWQAILDGAEDSPQSPLTFTVQEKQAAPCSGCDSFQMPVSLEAWYAQIRDTPSDINEHVATLRDLAQQCEWVVELGVRHDVSTVALLAGQPKHLTSVGLQPFAEVNALTSLAGATVFRFLQGDSRQIDAGDMDLLFVDTLHRAEHLWAELARHASRCRRWIVCHDTEIYGERGDDGGPGLLPALRKFVREHPEWSVVKHYRHNHGLTVLSRNSDDKPQTPNVARMAWNYAQARLKHLATGRKVLPEEGIDKRLDVCALCELRVDRQCSKCGCFLDEGPGGLDGKAVWPEQDCPFAKWPVVPLEYR